LFQENGLMRYETVVLKNVSLDEIDETIVKSYFERLGFVGEKPSEILMESLGIISQKVGGEGYSPTIGGLLVFGKNPFLYLPQAYIKVMYDDKTELFYGNILNMLDNTMGVLKDLIKDKDYPFEALEEVIANALVHRDYLDDSRGITINITPGFIEITNPGALVSQNSAYQFTRGNNPYRRNSWLYQRLLMLDHKKRFMRTGIGMTRIKNSFSGIGKVKFINIGSQ